MEHCSCLSEKRELQFIVLLQITVSLPLVHAEDRIFIEKSDEDSLKHMVVPFILFAVAISLITSTLFYFLWTEKQLLQEFLIGIQLEAKVIDYTVVAHSRCAEYFARIEFRCEEDVDGFGLVMRKDVQCTDSDIIVRRRPRMSRTKSPKPATNSDGLVVASTGCLGEAILTDRQNVNLDLEAGQDVTPQFSFSFDPGKLDPPTRVYILVTYLPGKPESAIGYGQVVRSTATTPTISLIGFLVACTCFCFFLGFQLIFANMSKYLILEASLLTTFTAIALECGLWQVFARDSVREMVYKDTIRCNGQCADFQTEYESLDTWSSSRMSWKTLSKTMDSSFAI